VVVHISFGFREIRETGTLIGDFWFSVVLKNIPSCIPQISVLTAQKIKQSA
jgi:hypothetical protein